MSITVTPTHARASSPRSPASTSPGRCSPPTATPSRTRSTATRSWCFAARRSATPSRSISRPISARSIPRPSARGTPASSIASSAPSSPTSPTSTATARCSTVNAKRRLDWLANRLWHTDASFRAVPGALSMLYAHVVPDEGGDTEFADLRAAYDALPDSDQEAARRPGRRCIRSGIRAASSASPQYTPEELASLPPVPQRWCAPIRARGARRSTSPRTPRTSSAGRCPTGACCCST